LGTLQLILMSIRLITYIANVVPIIGRKKKLSLAFHRHHPLAVAVAAVAAAAVVALAREVVAAQAV